MNLQSLMGYRDMYLYSQWQIYKSDGHMTRQMSRPTNQLHLTITISIFENRASFWLLSAKLG